MRQSWPVHPQLPSLAPGSGHGAVKNIEDERLMQYNMVSVVRIEVQRQFSNK